MDLGVREWMIIIGVLLIVAVVLDGYRRVRNERRGRIRVSLSRQARRAARSGESERPVEPPPTLTDDNPELPNGGARPASRRRGVPVLMQAVSDTMGALANSRAPVDDEPQREPAPERRYPNEEHRFDEPRYAERDEPDHDDWDDQPFADETEYDSDRRVADFVDEEADENERDWRRDYIAPHDDIEPEPDDEPLFAEQEPVRTGVASNAAASAAEPPASEPAPQEVLVIYVISRNRQGFKGQDLLQILLACDVRYAKSRLFYRYEEAKGQGPVQFGVANLTEEGTFDLDSMDGQTIPGVCFFITLPGPVKSLRAFDYMVETAQVLVKNLDGEMRDESRSVMTAQTLEHYRQRIRDFERKQLTFQL